MAGAKMERTRYPGVYRRGKRVVYEWVDAGGKHRRRNATEDTIDCARREKALREEEARAGLPASASPQTSARLTLASYAREMFGCDLSREKDQKPARGRFQGRSGAIRIRTLDTYRRDLENHWLPALGDYALDALKSQHIKRQMSALAGRDGEEYLRDATLRAIFAPLRAMLAEAAEEGLIDHNPAAAVKVPSGRDALRDVGDQGDEDDPDGVARILTRDELTMFFAVLHPDWRLLFELLLVTGLRISEAFALRWQDVQLDGDRPVVRVRRSWVAPRFGPPKSRHGKRDVPIPLEVADRLRSRHAAATAGARSDLVFASETGTPLMTENVRRRVLKPAAEEAGISNIGFHAFRHTCASTLIADGRNIVQVSRWLGHHSPAFTLGVYAHLLDEGVGEALSSPLAGAGTPALEGSLA